jgi:hypothetical protein
MRIAKGKNADLVDVSLEVTGHRQTAAQNEQAFLDLTDLKNEDFIYVL